MKFVIATLIGAVAAITWVVASPPVGSVRESSSESLSIEFVSEQQQEIDYTPPIDNTPQGADPTPAPDYGELITVPHIVEVQEELERKIKQYEAETEEYQTQISIYESQSSGNKIPETPSGGGNTERTEESNEDVPTPEPAQGGNLESLGVYTITHYCNCEICCGQWSGGATASGTAPTPGRTIAADLPFGTKIQINGQTYIVEDRGVSGNHIDIYVASHEEALSLGMYQIEVFKIKDN